MTTRWAMPVASSVCSVERLALDQVLELHDAALLGDDRHHERIPFGDPVALASRYGRRRTSDARRRGCGAIARSRPSMSTIASSPLRAIATRRPRGSMMVGRSRNSTVPSADRLEARRLVELRRAADVEGPHRQLGARLADRLGGDDADRLADVDRRAAGEIAPVALAADAMLALADQRRADLDRLDADLVDLQRPSASSISSPSLTMHVAGLGVDDVLGRGAAEDALAERGDDRAALDDRAHVERVARCRNPPRRSTQSCDTSTRRRVR